MPDALGTRRVRNATTGEVYDFPMGTPDEEVHGYFSRSGQQAQQQQVRQSPIAPIAQTFLQGLQQAQQPASTLPNISGRSLIGLAPEQAQSVLGMAQQSNQDSLRKRLEQQRMMQQSMEYEKDRQQQLKLKQQELRNALAEKKLEQEAAKAKAEFDLQLEDLKFGRDKEIEGMRQEGRLALEQERGKRPMRVGKSLVGPDGKPLYTDPTEPKEPKPRIPAGSPIPDIAIDNETGEEVKVMRQWFSDGSYELYPYIKEEKPKKEEGAAVLGVPIRDFETMVNSRVRMRMDAASADVNADPPPYDQIYGEEKSKLEEEVARARGLEVFRVSPTVVYYADPNEDQPQE